MTPLTTPSFFLNKNQDKMKNEHPNPDSRNPMLHYRKYFLLFGFGLLLIVVALALMGSSAQPAPVKVTEAEKNLRLMEFKVKLGEELTEKELEHYCQLLCQARGICGISNCQDAVSLYRESALAHLRETLKGQILTMPDGKAVKITGEGLRHTLKGKNLKNPREYAKNIKFIDSTFGLKEIIKKVKYSHSEPSKKGNCKSIHIYKGKLTGGYRIRIIVKEAHSGEYTFYDYSLKREGR